MPCNTLLMITDRGSPNSRSCYWKGVKICTPSYNSHFRLLSKIQLISSPPTPNSKDPKHPPPGVRLGNVWEVVLHLIWEREHEKWCCEHDDRGVVGWVWKWYRSKERARAVILVLAVGGLGVGYYNLIVNTRCTIPTSARDMPQRQD